MGKGFRRGIRDMAKKVSGWLLIFAGGDGGRCAGKFIDSRLDVQYLLLKKHVLKEIYITGIKGCC